LQSEPRAASQNKGDNLLTRVLLTQNASTKQNILCYVQENDKAFEKTLGSNEDFKLLQKHN